MRRQDHTRKGKRILYGDGAMLQQLRPRIFRGRIDDRSTVHDLPDEDSKIDLQMILAF